MAKKKDKSRADAVRQAVDQAFQAGQSQFTRERAQELVDELAQTAGKVRDALDDLRPPTADDVKELRAQVRALERRVKALEDKPKPKPRRASTTRRASGSSS